MSKAVPLSDETIALWFLSSELCPLSSFLSGAVKRYHAATVDIMCTECRIPDNSNMCVIGALFQRLLNRRVLDVERRNACSKCLRELVAAFNGSNTGSRHEVYVEMVTSIHFSGISACGHHEQSNASNPSDSSASEAAIIIMF